MGAVKWIAIWGLTSIAASLLGAFVAAVKNRDPSFWGFWGFILPPMIIALFVIPSLKEPRPRRARDDDQLD